MTKVPITAKGAQRLRQQLKEMKTVDRPRITQAIAEARAHGDLSENAEYHAAREQQSFLEGRIAAIEHALADAQVIDVTTLNTDSDCMKNWRLVRCAYGSCRRPTLTRNETTVSPSSAAEHSMRLSLRRFSTRVWTSRNSLLSS